jgi:hypothetical protein
MAMRDLASNLALRESIRPAVHSAATVTGETVDTRGFESAMVAITVGAVASSGNVTPKLQHSLDGSTNWDDVTAGDLIGAFPAALVTNTTYKVGYRGGRRYVRVFGTLNSGTSVAYSAVLVLGNPAQKPA